MQSVGAQMLNPSGYGSMLSGQLSQRTAERSFNNVLGELEEDIAETRNELEFCKMEV